MRTSACNYINEHILVLTTHVINNRKNTMYAGAQMLFNWSIDTRGSTMGVVRALTLIRLCYNCSGHMLVGDTFVRFRILKKPTKIVNTELG